MLMILYTTQTLHRSVLVQISAYCTIQAHLRFDSLKIHFFQPISLASLDHAGCELSTSRLNCAQAIYFSLITIIEREKDICLPAQWFAIKNQSCYTPFRLRS